MIAHRIVSIVLLFTLAGCGEKASQAPTNAPAEPKIALEPQKPPEPKKEPSVVPVTPADKARVEEAEKKGAAVYEAQNGGFEVRIEHEADAEAILAALKGTKCIVGLSIEGDKLTDAALANVGSFEFLERLTLHRCPKLTGSGFESLTKLAHLKALAVSECPLADVGCAPLGHIKSLEEVRFLRTKITDAGVRELAALPALELLALEGSPVSGSAFATAGWPKLRDLDAPNTAFTDTGMKAVASLPALERLNVDFCKITDASLRSLEHTKKLAELSLNNTKVTDAGLEAIKGVDSLRVLEVANTAVAGKAFGSYPTRPGFRKLNAAGTKIDDSGAANLAKFPGLTALSLAGCPVSDAGLTSLKGMKKLAKCDLSGTRAGDTTAKLLGALPDLEDANFANTKLTDAGVKALAVAPKIRQIDARGTKATKEGAERAKMGRTRVDIRVE